MDSSGQVPPRYYGGIPDNELFQVIFSVFITLQEAEQGCEKQIQLAQAPCLQCRGTGDKNGVQGPACNACNGTGMLVKEKKILFSNFVRTKPCKSCRASGRITENPCPACGGSGKTGREVRLVIPPKTQHGALLPVDVGMGPDAEYHVRISVVVSP